MKKRILFTQISFLLMLPNALFSQFNEEKIGAWYMYFFDTTFKESKWGLQGDVQYRNWNIGDDLEQLLIRGGLTYKPETAKIKFTLGYGNITTGAFGESSATSSESRIYQEALFPVQFGNRFYTNHRFRFEQRFVENQDFRSRYRYNLFLNIPLNKVIMDKKTIYLALYNEVFINGQRNIGNNNSVEIFDRNRFYTAIGYILNSGIKIQLGILNQTTNSWNKNQLQLSLHHKF